MFQIQIVQFLARIVDTPCFLNPRPLQDNRRSSDGVFLIPAVDEKTDHIVSDDIGEIAFINRLAGEMNISHLATNALPHTTGKFHLCRKQRRWEFDRVENGLRHA